MSKIKSFLLGILFTISIVVLLAATTEETRKGRYQIASAGNDSEAERHL